MLDECVVTAASQNHAKSMFSLLQHIGKFNIFMYDLGLSDDNLQRLKAVHPRVVVHRFPFHDYPKFFEVFGEYAWKPAIIETMLRQCKAVLWLDAGDRVNSRLLPSIFAKIHRGGFISSQTSGTVKTWVHPETRRALATRKFVVSDHKPMCNGAIVGIDQYHHTRPMQRIVLPWLQCALNQSCIAPPGSSRGNHRQDQAVLTVIAHSVGFGSACYTGYHGIRIHQDDDWKRGL